jgi:hypothetical protein
VLSRSGSPRTAKCPLDEHPVVVPAGQQVAQQVRGGQVQVVEVGARVPGPDRPGGQVTDVDAHTRGDRERAPGGVEQPRRDPVQPPQRRPQARLRLLLRDVAPQLAGDRRPAGPSGQADEGHQPLHGTGDGVPPGLPPPVREQGEAVQQVDPRVHEFPLRRCPSDRERRWPR